MRLRSDLVSLCNAAIDGGLANARPDWDARVALAVVLAAGGYPGTIRKGDIISGIADDAGSDVKVFHAGTAERDGKVVTSGGRVLCVCALGDSVRDAQQRAYSRIDSIRFAGMQFRRDIGYRAIAREA
jgi:phosphoribosylamine---glycine ligase